MKSRQIVNQGVNGYASMLYLDYSRGAGEWVPNVFGGRENLKAIDFLKSMNEQVYRAFPDTLTAAEESTAWPKVPRPLYHGGLGFGYKWDMGWMHDTLGYVNCLLASPVRCHGQTFSLNLTLPPLGVMFSDATESHHPPPRWSTCSRPPSQARGFSMCCR